MSLIADLRDELQTERTKFREDRDKLLDRIMALANPPVYRIMQNPQPPQQDPRFNPAQGPMRPHIPGSFPPPPRPTEAEKAAAEALLEKAMNPNGSK